MRRAAGRTSRAAAGPPQRHGTAWLDALSEVPVGLDDHRDARLRGVPERVGVRVEVLLRERVDVAVRALLREGGGALHLDVRVRVLRIRDRERDPWIAAQVALLG